MSFEDLTFEEFEENESLCQLLEDKISGISNYFRSISGVEVPNEKMGIKHYSCQAEISLSTEKDYTYRNFKSKKLNILLMSISYFDYLLESRFDENQDEENDTDYIYLIKWKNGEAQAITFEYAKTQEGLAALNFADEASEDVFVLHIDDALDEMMDICHSKKVVKSN